MVTLEKYNATVERWTLPSNVPTVRIGRRDGRHYIVQSPLGRTPRETDEMLEELRRKMRLGSND